MKRHVGTVLTTSLAALALGLAVLQGVVLLQTAPVSLAELSAPPAVHRGVPRPEEATPASRARTTPPPEGKQPEERRHVPSHQRGLFMPGQPGPRPPRKLTA